MIPVIASGRVTKLSESMYEGCKSEYGLKTKWLDNKLTLNNALWNCPLTADHTLEHDGLNSLNA